MASSAIHDFHSARGGIFGEGSDPGLVRHYGDWRAEYTALRQSAVVFDLSARGRLCLLGADRERFLNGQVTNNVRTLRAGEGCYAVLVNAKGRIESDLNIFRLDDEFLLDFEPGLTAAVTGRFERFIIADDVQVVDAAPHYGLLSVQGPGAGEVISALPFGVSLPARPFDSVRVRHSEHGDLFLTNHPRVGLPGFEVFVPAAAMAACAEALATAVELVGGRLAGWQALELARIEGGIPRFGQDMDSTNLAPEAGIEARAINYAKGCYIGQEIIARIRTYGQVARALRGLRLTTDLACLPARGEKLFKDGKDVGYITSAAHSPTLNADLALGYVRRECNALGTELLLRCGNEESRATIVPLPFIAHRSNVNAG